MRNFSKTLISMAAVMAVGSAMAAGAMAADLTIGQDTLKTDGKISISGVTADKSQYTLLVVQGTTAEGSTEVTYNATESTIKQIDQNDAGAAFTEAVVGTDLADGSYKVMVGNNDGTVDEGIFTVSSAPVVETVEIMVGDIDLGGSLKMNDIAWLKKKVATTSLTEYSDIRYAGTERTKADGTAVIIGDIDLGGSLKMNDIAWLKKKVATTSLTEYSDIRYAGTPVEVVVE